MKICFCMDCGVKLYNSFWGGWNDGTYKSIEYKEGVRCVDCYLNKQRRSRND